MEGGQRERNYVVYTLIIIPYIAYTMLPVSCMTAHMIVYMSVQSDKTQAILQIVHISPNRQGEMETFHTAVRLGV